jgi:hypothetical protein
MHFFGCRNCGQNFANETTNMSQELRNPYDEVKYLWISMLTKMLFTFLLKFMLFF